MIEPHTTTRMDALIEDTVSGQVAVGKYDVRIHSDHGAVVHLAQPGQQPVPRLRPSPVLLRPPAVDGFLARQADLAAILTAVRANLPVEIQGPPGIGKSILLCHLAHTVEAGDGVIHLSARRQPAADLVQSLFEAFYECDAPFKPSAAQARQLLQGRKAVVLIDSCELEREAAEELLDTAPECAFVLATRERCLQGEDSRAVCLGGLSREDAQTLFERELGRPLKAEEGAAFESLHARLEGHPLRLLQAAAQVREGQPVIEAVPIHADTFRHTLAPLPNEEKHVLCALAAIGGGPVDAAPLATLAGVPDPSPAVNVLLERKLIQAHSPRYSLTGDLSDVLASTWDLSHWRERALAFFLPWAEAHREDPAALRKEMSVLRHVLDWAAEAGLHDEARRLGRTLDTACTVGGCWGAWEQILERVRGAAGALGDRATEGWALHQLGTRRLCLDDKAGAGDLLTQALAIRESLGDRDGAAATRNNLDLLGTVPTLSAPVRKTRLRSIPFRPLPWLAAALLTLLAVIVGTGWYFSHRNEGRPPSTGSNVLALSTAGASEQAPKARPDSTTLPARTEVPADTTDFPVDAGLSPEATDEPMVSDPSSEAAAETRGTPDMEIQPKALRFGKVEVGQSHDLPVTVRNSGDVPLTIAASLSGKSVEEFGLGRGCGEISPGQSCELILTFKPTSPGRPSSDLTVTDRASGIKWSLSLQGYATSTEEPKRPSAPVQVPAVPLGWCCLPIGSVKLTTPVECIGNGGKLLPSAKDEQQASAECAPN